MSTFTYFGEKFSYAEEFPAFEYAEFMEAMSEDELDDGRATGVALRLAVACVAEDDRGRFRAASRKNRAQVKDWLFIYRQWTAEVAERPTGEPTVSSAGLDDTPKNSESAPVATVTELPERPVRPDLALAVARSRAA